MARNINQGGAAQGQIWAPAYINRVGVVKIAAKNNRAARHAFPIAASQGMRRRGGEGDLLNAANYQAETQAISCDMYTKPRSRRRRKALKKEGRL